MCTVTFIPVKDKLFFTSNRDEQHVRSAALAPEIYDFPSGRVLFPKDGDAGGTWIAAHESGNAVVFLNGGWERHIPAPPYRKSRGLILLDLIDSHTPYNSFLAINLNNIEPFTAVIRDDGQLFECRWDGREKHSRQMDALRPHIWSSVTLYEAPVIQKREEWFRQWLTQHPAPGGEEIRDFHRFTGDGDSHNDLLMNRNGKVFTVSITSLALSDGAADMHYLDLRQQLATFRGMSFEKSMADR